MKRIVPHMCTELVSSNGIPRQYCSVVKLNRRQYSLTSKVLNI